MNVSAWSIRNPVPSLVLFLVLMVLGIMSFQSLPVTYRLYQADSPEDLAKAVAEVGRQQNFPLDFEERVPRQDHSRLFFSLAALCCALLLVYRSLLLRSWL